MESGSMLLPDLRTLLAAAFVIQIVATCVAAALMRAPAESLAHAAVLPKLEEPPLRPARPAAPKQQSRMTGYASEAEPPTSAPGTETMDGGTSVYAKTQATLGPKTVESDAPSSASARASDQPAANPNEERIDPAVTEGVHRASIATSNRNVALNGFRGARSKAHARDPRRGIFGWRRIRASPDRGAAT
jgi:hypothetical protein